MGVDACDKLWTYCSRKCVVNGAQNVNFTCSHYSLFKKEEKKSDNHTPCCLIDLDYMAISDFGCYYWKNACN